MTRGPTVSLLLLAALAAAAAALLLVEEGDEQPLMDAQLRLESAPADTIEADAAEIDPVIAYEEIETDEFDEEDESRPAPASSRETPRYVRVLGFDGKPVKAATVLLVREGRAKDQRRRAYDRSSPAAPYRTLRTRSDGHAPLHPLPRRAFRIEAWTADGFGAVRFLIPRKRPETAPRTVDLHLQPSPSIRARVRQEDGTPAPEVRVEIHPDPSVRHRWDDRIAIWTDDQGSASGRLTFENAWARRGAAVLASVRLLDGTRVTTPPVTPVDGAYDFDITVPRLGTLRLALVLPTGEPYEGAASLTWWRITDPVKKRNVGRVTANGGFAIIGAAPPGERLVVRIKTKGREDALCGIDVDGSGMPQDVVCGVGSRGARLSMTLTTPEGDVLPKQRFRVQVIQDDDEARASRLAALDPAWRHRPTTSIRTRKDGRTSMTVRTGSPGQVLVFVDRKRSRKRGAQAPQEPDAVVSFPVLEEEATHEAGAIPLPSFRVLAAGLLVDSEGDPVAGARVGVQLEQPSPKGRNRPKTLATASTDKQGAFIVLGESPPAGRLFVDARTREGVAEAQEIGLGTRNLRLVLQRYGRVTGRVTLADASLPLKLEIRMNREDGLHPQRVSISRDRKGRVAARGLVPGLYGITVHLAGLEALSLHGISVREGETVTPPALADLVVGQAFRRGSVLVRDEYGAPLAKARIYTRERSELPTARAQSVSTNSRGEATVAWRPGVPIDVNVQTPVWRQRYKNATFPLTVTVGEQAPGSARGRPGRQPGQVPPLVITFDAPLPKYKPIRSYTLQLTKVGDASERPRRERTRVRGRPDRAIYNSIGRGTYAVVLEVRVTAEKPRSGTRRGRVDMGRITVRGTGRERVKLRVDFAGIDHAVRNAR